MDPETQQIYELQGDRREALMDRVPGWIHRIPTPPTRVNTGVPLSDRRAARCNFPDSNTRVITDNWQMARSRALERLWWGKVTFYKTIAGRKGKLKGHLPTNAEREGREGEERFSLTSQTSWTKTTELPATSERQSRWHSFIIERPNIYSRPSSHPSLDTSNFAAKQVQLAPTAVECYNLTEDGGLGI